MASTSEVGHAKNIANFQDLIPFVTGYGATYAPTKTALTLSELNALYTTAQQNLAHVIDKNTNYNKIVNNRISAFSTLKPLATRVVNALDATDADSQTMADAKAFNRKLQGKSTATTSPVAHETPAPNTIPTSQ